MTTNLSRRTFFGAAVGTTALGLGMFRTVSAAEAIFGCVVGFSSTF